MEPVPAPSRLHKLVFWFLLATLSMALPEVGTLNDPIPWLHPGGWLLGYPVYGLHILVLAGLMYRWPIAGFTTLMAYGGLFGLYEGYMIKQLWNPNWGMELTASIGGVRVIQTLFLVFWVHPLLAFAVPLVFCELLAVAPGRLTRRLPLLSKTRRRTALFLVVMGLYLGVMIGRGLEDHGKMVIPLIALAVVAGLGLLWRVVLRGHRWCMDELLPRGAEFWILTGLLGFAYLVIGALVRPEAFPGAWLPHILVWCIYGFLSAVIVFLTRGARPIEDEVRPARSNAEAILLGCLGATVFLAVIWVHIPHPQPGETVAILTFFGGAVCNIAVLIWCGVKGAIIWHRRTGLSTDGTAAQ